MRLKETLVRQKLSANVSSVSVVTTGPVVAGQAGNGAAAGLSSREVETPTGSAKPPERKVRFGIQSLLSYVGKVCCPLAPYQVRHFGY